MSKPDELWDIEQTRQVIQRKDIKCWTAYRSEHREWNPIISNADHKLVDAHDASVVLSHIAKFDLRGAVMEHMSLNEQDFNQKCLDGASFKHLQCWNCNFGGASLRNLNATDAKFFGCHFTGTDFSGANLTRVRFLQHCNVRKTRFVDTAGLYGPDKAIFENVDDEEWAIFSKSRWDGLTRWENLRFIGGLNLLGLSYTTVLIVIIYGTVLKWYNIGLRGVQGWVGEHGMESMEWVSRVPPLPASVGFVLQVIATMLLAIAATLYAKWCPSLVKENSETRWSRELGHSLIEYRAAAHSHRVVRYICATLLCLGGIYTIVYLAYRFVMVIRVFVWT